MAPTSSVLGEHHHDDSLSFYIPLQNEGFRYFKERTDVIIMKFKIESEYRPSGDQPEAIKGLCSALDSGVDAVTLLGVTGSGKTFTMANVIERLQRPALILSHNKTLMTIISLKHTYRPRIPILKRT